jgi:glycosyltransferase involved in cell wall biosynthesis
MLPGPMIPASPASLDLSVVIPAHDEIENLEPLLAELRAALARCGDYELLLVDDASGDGTGERIAEEARRDPRVRGLHLEPRGGQSAALAAGFARARGRVVATLDADLQNDPADLPRLIAALAAADVASGIRAERHDSPLRRLSSRVANAARRAAIGDTITDIGCSLKAYRREALALLPPFAGMHRFLPALCQLRGARVVEIPVRHRPRRHGTSKYGVGNRLGRGLYDLIGVRWLRSRLLRSVAREIGR